MNFRSLFVVVLLFGGTSALAAQTVVQPEPKLSAEAQVVSDALYQLRDSLILVDAAGARIARDRAQASDASLRSRARLLADRCRTALTISDSTRATVARGGFPDPDPLASRTRLEQSIVQLKGKLTWCESEFARLSQLEQSEELRGYGIGRAAQVNRAVQSYTTEMASYLMKALGVRYNPRVRGAGSVASGR